MVACVCVCASFFFFILVFVSASLLLFLCCFTAFVIRVLLSPCAERHSVPAQNDVCYYWSFCKCSKTYSSNKKNFIGWFWIHSCFFAIRPTNFYLCNKTSSFSFLSFAITICITLSSSLSSSWPLMLSSSTSSSAYSINEDANYQRRNHQF